MSQPKSSAPLWSVAVMCYNEKDCLAEMVQRTLAVLRRRGEAFEILIIDDGSTDGSAQIADTLAAAHPEVSVRHHPKNLGIGAVLRAGYNLTKGQVVAVLPADLQFAPEDLPAAMDRMAQADVLSILRRERNDSLPRKLISLTDRLLVWLLFGLAAKDLHWVKLYRREVLDKIELQSNTPLVDTELLIKAKRLGARMAELSLPQHPRSAGKSKGGNWRLLLKTFFELLRLRLNIRS
jgi:glycosyltransferase involved in cell wall biosynthesis